MRQIVLNIQQTLTGALLSQHERDVKCRLTVKLFEKERFLEICHRCWVLIDVVSFTEENKALLDLQENWEHLELLVCSN
jgi:hypothetical protein